MNRRTFVQIGALLAVAKPIDSLACAESFITVSHLEGLPVTVGNETRESYLRRELNAHSFEVDHGERIRTTVQERIEGAILPFRVDIVGDPCTELAVFIERYAPYRGKRLASSLETRETYSMFGHVTKAELLTLRFRGLTMVSTDTTLVGAACRFKQTLRTDVRFIVAATVPTNNGGKKIYVTESRLIVHLGKHCGGTYFVDSYDDAVAETRSQKSVYLVHF